MDKFNKLKGLLDMVKESGRNWDLLQTGRGMHVLCDMDDNQKTIKAGSLDYLIGFCEGILYID